MERPKGSKNKNKAEQVESKKRITQNDINRVKKAAEKRAEAGEPAKVYSLMRPDYSDGEISGEPKGCCKICGKVFDQDINYGQGRYTSFNTCPDCRSRIAREKSKKAEQQKTFYNAVLPYTPFPKQAEMHEAFENHRFICLACGNRFGKDRFSIMAGIKYFVECLAENRVIHRPDMVPAVYWWIVAPTEKLAKQIWMELCRYFPRDWVVGKSETTMTMETINGGVVEVRSAYDPESLVGVGLDLVTITEAARIKDLLTVWANLEARLGSPGRGRAIDRKNSDAGMGKAIINSSPIGKNFFYDMWTWGQHTHDNYDSNWVSFQCPWTDNPVNAQKAEEIVHTRNGDILYAESLRRRIGDRAYRQNYMADFLSENGSVFPTFKETCLVDLFSPKLNYTLEQRKEAKAEWERPKVGHRYRLSWDIATGSSGDSPTLIVRDLEENKITRIFDLYGNDYEAQYEVVAYWSKTYNNAPCVFSSTGHTPCVGQLAKRGVEEIVINEQGANKASYIQNLVYAIQSGDVHVLEDGTAESETLIHQMDDYTESNGRYSNSREAHDDFVSAMYLNYYDYAEASMEMPWTGLMDCI